ncbi:MAG TPA: DUF177 domain-containing protein [Bacteroidales bacterium]|nr:DUF177 domain-containing protein [Bacteroidales bacterium]
MKMVSIAEYDIYFSGKSNGFYSFDYIIGNDFFKLFPKPPIEEGTLNVHLQMEKKQKLLIFDFKITGEIALVCDNCLEKFMSPVLLTAKQYVKLGQIYEELDEVTISIPHSEEKINVAQWIYETIVLSIPIRRVHPLDENGHPTCNPDMIKRIKDLSQTNQIKKDSRWDKLTTLLN